MLESMRKLACAKRASVWPVTLAILLSALAGCAAPGPRPADTGDSCATERAALRGSRDYYDQAVAKGEAVGGAIGGAVGSAVGTLAGWLTGTDQSERPTAMGVAAGAAVGGYASYYLAKLETATDAVALGGAVLQDLLAENQEIDRATVSFARLRECRFAAAREVKADLAAGRIAESEAVARLGTLRKRFAEDVVIAEEVGAKMSTRSSELQYASAELLRQDPTAPVQVEAERKTAARKTRTAPTRPAPAPPRPAAAVAEAAETNQLKQKAFADDVAGARCEAAAAFSLEGTVSLLAPGRGFRSAG